MSSTDPTSELPTISVEQMLDYFSRAVGKESELISQRMTWLMTLDSFLVGGLALVMTNLKELSGAFAGYIVVAIGTVGLLANATTFFANYWADRATQEADLALRKWIATTNQSSHAIDALLRLFGRDPTDQLRAAEDARFWAPKSKIVQPWFALPAAFFVGSLGVLALTQIGGGLSVLDTPLLFCVLVPAVPVAFLALMVLLAGRDRTRNRSRQKPV